MGRNLWTMLWITMGFLSAKKIFLCKNRKKVWITWENLLIKIKNTGKICP